MPQVRWDGSPAVALVTEQHASATFIIDGVMPAQAQGVRVLVLPWLIGDHDVEATTAAGGLKHGVESRNSVLNWGRIKASLTP